MDVLSSPEMIALEKQAFHSGLSAGVLMEAVGKAMTERIAAIYPKARDFIVLVGKGNNGGDGLVVARHLAATGKTVRVILAAPDDQLGELPGAQLAQLRNAFPQINISHWSNDVVFPDSSGVVVDALLGIQAKGTLRGIIAEIVAKLNAARAARFFRTVALDFPTGLCAYEEGAAPEDRNAAVIADVTIAVGFAKNALVREALSAWVGRLEVVAWSNAAAESASRQVLLANELAGLLPRRSAFSYKGNYGKLVIVAGSRGFTGAPVLCAQAAQAMGTGLLSVVTHSDAADVVATQAPHEAMVSGWKGGKIPEVLKKATAIVIGPGLGVDQRSCKMLHAVLDLGVPTVVDADGLTAINVLNDFGKNPKLLRKIKAPLILTPHVGEMAHLIFRKFKPDERETVARKFVDQNKVTLVLKGTRTLVTAPGQPFFINTTGNPGLSTGGSGDTLSGILGALLAQGLSSLDACRLGVWLHGHAADMVLAERGCEEGLTPTMLSAHIGAALVSLRSQAVAQPGLIESCRS